MRRGWWDRSERLRFALTLVGAAVVFYAMSQYQVGSATNPVTDTTVGVATPRSAEVVPSEVTAIPAVEVAPDTVTIDAGPGWTWWGDSLTARAGSEGESAPAALSRLIGEPVFNFGVPGERSDQIAARSNGAPAVLTVVGGLIPASGGVQVQPDVELLLNRPRSLRGTVAGIEGRLARDDAGTYTFTRRVDGEAVPLDAAPFSPPPPRPIGTTTRSCGWAATTSRTPNGSLPTPKRSSTTTPWSATGTWC